MAFNVGSAPVGVLAKALTGNIFIEKSLAFMNEGDKDGYNAYKHDIKNVLRLRSANPMDTITNTTKKQVFKRTLTVVDSGETFNPSDYENYWKEWQPDGEFDWQTLPSNIQASLEELFLGSSAEATEDLLTNGNTSLGLVGLIGQLESSVYTPLSVNGVKTEPTPTQVVNNTSIAYRAHGGGTGEDLAVPLTSDNIFEKLELLIKNQTKSMRKRPNRKFMISNGTGDLIRTAQRLKLTFKGVDVTEEGVLRYAGFDMIENPSFPDNTLLLCSMSGDMKTDAIQLGTSMSSDFNNLVVDKISTFSREYGMLLTFAIDIFVVRPEEVCFYTQSTIV